METNKAAGPDVFPVEFFQNCWGIIKNDILNMFNDFFNGTLDVNRLNYGIITLIPKCANAERIQQYRPICLLNCVYKWITKGMTIKIEPFMHKWISKCQNAFIKGRNIMDGVMSLHDILHETKRKNQVGVILKLDFEKAYNEENWDFLFSCLEARGFSPLWQRWIKQVVTGGTLSVKLNNQIGPYFKSHNGVRQGDPLSPFLFNLLADVLAKMIEKAQSNNLVEGLIAHLFDKGIGILQYVDDTILCLKHDVDKANM
uniref:Reverse transcriptase domain-containing protein n=1 Tax=Arundo donax TaxID=35708 RepID=A0A0A9GRN8_ARUDO